MGRFRRRENNLDVPLCEVARVGFAVDMRDANRAVRHEFDCQRSASDKSMEVRDSRPGMIASIDLEANLPDALAAHRAIINLSLGFCQPNVSQREGTGRHEEGRGGPDSRGNRENCAARRKFDSRWRYHIKPEIVEISGFFSLLTSANVTELYAARSGNSSVVTAEAKATNSRIRRGTSGRRLYAYDRCNSGNRHSGMTSMRAPLERNEGRTIGGKSPIIAPVRSNSASPA